MADETAALADYVAKLKFEDLPTEVVDRAKTLALDFIGGVVRARHEAESTTSLLRMLEELSLDATGNATVFGDARLRTPAIAALMNGVFGHSLEFDDNHAEASLRPSAPIIPAAFAVGEHVGASGKDVIAAIVAGYETCCRLGNALDATSLYARGFHPTSIAGTFAATVVASNLYKLSTEQLVSAFGVAGSQAAGSLQFMANGSWSKRYQVGAAAMNGIVAATLARQNFLGSAAAIEGKHGLLTAFSDNAHPERVLDGLGQSFETMKIGIKPYPSCRYTHAAVDALLALRQEHKLTADRIRHVRVGLHRNGIVLSGDAATKRHPRTISAGQFSMYFAGAVALDQGRFGWDEYKKLGDPAIESLADRVEVVEDDLTGINCNHSFGARVQITTTDGTVLERTVADPLGEPTLFPDARTMRRKFLGLAQPILGDRAEQLANAILNLEGAASLDAVTALGRSVCFSLP